MNVSQKNEREDIPILSDDVPVTMPVLPLSRMISTEQQFKAASDATRSRILGIIQNQPATAKQIAERLGATPGTIGHHLRVLEEAGLAQVVARRLTRGIVANYYTRTARIFSYDVPDELAGDAPVGLSFIDTARAEMLESYSSHYDDQYANQSFPHVRLSPERAQVYYERLQALVDDLIQEQYDPNGEVYGVLLAMFRSPGYMQTAPAGREVDDSEA